jgi:hypothetical protein
MPGVVDQPHRRFSPPRDIEDNGACFARSANSTPATPEPAVLDAAKGSVRFSTGAQGGNRNYQVKTPYGTLGIRG